MKSLVAALVLFLSASAITAHGEEDAHALASKFMSLCKQGQYDLAIEVGPQAIQAVEQEEGQNNYHVVALLEQLATVYIKVHRLADATVAFEQASAIQATLEDADSPDRVKFETTLAKLYFAQKQYARALPHYQTALAIQEKMLGPDDPAEAATLNNLAISYDMQKQFEQAEPLFKRALAIREKALDPKDKQLVQSIKNLANLYRETNRIAEAQTLEARISGTPDATQ